MPRAVISRDKDLFFEAAIALRILSAFFSAKPSNCNRSSFVSLYRSATSLTKPALTNCSTILIPNPTISIAPRDTKCSKLRTNCAGHAALTQYQATSPSKCSTDSPQAGQVSGGIYSISFPVLAPFTGPITYGMTSPALLTNTRSPTRISFSAI